MSFKMVVSDFLQAAYFFDTSLYRTMTGLLLRPGMFSKDFLEGKRQRYAPPFQVFFLFLAVYLIFLNYFGDNIFDFLDIGIKSENDTISKTELISSLVRKNLNLLYFILTPIIAFFIRLFYKKVRFNYSEILMFSFYIIGVGLFLSTIIALFSLIEAKLFAFKALITFGYFPFAIMQFTNSKSFLGIIKALSTVIISYLVFTILTIVLVSLYVFVFLT